MVVERERGPSFFAAQKMKSISWCDTTCTSMTWLIYMDPARNQSVRGNWDIFVCETWLVHKWHNLSTWIWPEFYAKKMRRIRSYVTWPAHVRREAFTCHGTHVYVTWLIRMWRRDYTYVAWLIHMWNELQDAFTCYWVATISRPSKIIGLFCRISSVL